MTSNILKGNTDHIKNYVTLVDISSMLKHPEDRSRVRTACKSFLKGLQGENPSIAPQLKTWFYIYKNNIVNDDFKNRIRDNYFVDVKDIDRQNDYEAESIPTMDEDKDSDLAYAEDAKRNDNKNQAMNAAQPASNVAVPSTTDDTTNSKDIPDFETLKKNKLEAQDETRLIDDQVDSSKFDEVVEDRQYVEVPVIREEISKQTTDDDTISIPKNVEAAEATEISKEVAKEISKDTVKETENLEIMQAEARHLGQRQFGSTNTGEVASALSGNSIVGRKLNRKCFCSTDCTTKEIGQFRSNNYDLIRKMFFTPRKRKKIPVKMMRARGFYKIVDCKSLKAKAIDLPYDNERYSFLVLLPNARDGLKAMLDDLSPNTIPEIMSQMQEESIDISIPKFSIDTTGGVEKNLAKNGLASIFTSKADLSGITTEQTLHIEELQQHVALRVDEGSSSENFFTATNALRSNAQPEQSITVDRPFSFFVRDVADGVIIMAGKVSLPPSDDEPTI